MICGLVLAGLPGAGDREERPGVCDPAQFVRAAVSEQDAGAEDQVLDRPRDEDLSGLGERGDAVGDVHGGPGYIVPHEIHFTGVDSGTQLDPACGSVVAEGYRAADRLPWSGEGGEDARPGALDEAAAVRTYALAGWRQAGLGCRR